MDLDRPETQWRAFVEHALDGMLLTVTDGRILAANPAACALLDRTEDEIRAIGRAGVAVMDDAARRFMADRARDGRARGVLTVKRRDGSTFLAEVTSTMFATDRGETLTSMTVRDVTEVERARRALEVLADAGRVLASSLEPRETLRHLTDLVVPELADVCTVDLLEPDGVSRVAVAHRDPARAAEFEQVRRRAIRPDAAAGVDFVLRTGEPSCVWELTDEALAGFTLDREHFLAARALGVRSFLSVPLRAGKATIGALTLQSVGGVPPFSAADLPLVQALGERAATAIDNANRHAEALEARRLRDEVLDVVAHDLRGPLGTIRLAAGVLARRASGPEIETVRRAVERADALLHDLLLASKAEGGSLPLELAPHDVLGLLDEVRALHAPLADARSLTLEVVLEGGPLRIVADGHRVLQLLSNLAGNALKFTAPGGRVELRAARIGDRVRFTVADTGPGIAPDQLPHVFDRYWQGAHARHLGAGLGTSISRAIALAHGGDVTVESVLGRGTTFTVLLPLDARTARDHEALVTSGPHEA